MTLKTFSFRVSFASEGTVETKYLNKGVELSVLALSDFVCSKVRLK